MRISMKCVIVLGLVLVPGLGMAGEEYEYEVGVGLGDPEDGLDCGQTFGDPGDGMDIQIFERDGDPGDGLAVDTKPCLGDPGDGLEGPFGDPDDGHENFSIFGDSGAAFLELGVMVAFWCF